MEDIDKEERVLAEVSEEMDILKGKFYHQIKVSLVEGSINGWPMEKITNLGNSIEDRKEEASSFLLPEPLSKNPLEVTFQEGATPSLRIGNISEEEANAYQLALLEEGYVDTKLDAYFGIDAVYGSKESDVALLIDYVDEGLEIELCAFESNFGWDQEYIQNIIKEDLGISNFTLPYLEDTYCVIEFYGDYGYGATLYIYVGGDVSLKMGDALLELGADLDEYGYYNFPECFVTADYMEGITYIMIMAN